MAVILVDANLLIYAWNSDSPEHAVAKAWLDRKLNEIEGVAIPWPSLLAFVRIVTNPRIFSEPASPSAAWSQVREWIERDNVFVPEPTENHFAVLSRMVELADRANLVPDAHIAAIALEYGLILCSTDRDFARFPGLRWHNPLADHEHQKP